MALQCKKSITPVSRCIYCNSTSYGKGCRYGSSGLHFHAEDPKKCSYCGSPSFGYGCKLNPTKLHLHGIPYNSMLTDSIKNMLRNSFLLNELNKPFTEFTAYELGIINHEGRKIREPVTEDETRSYSLLTRSILKIKKYLGIKTELLINTSLLEKVTEYNYNNEKHKILLAFESKFQAKVSEIYELINDAVQSGLTLEEIDAYIQK